MTKARKRKVPVTVVSVAGTSHASNQIDASHSSKPESSRAVITRFHVLLKRRTQLEKQPRSEENARALADVERDIEALGGLAAYQRMSSIGQGKDRGGGSEKVFIGWLKELGMHEQMRQQRLRLLEVGALKPDNYQSHSSWIDVTPIDVRSKHANIKEQDFLLMDPVENANSWDAISLSLVVNFVPEPTDRGRMLTLAYTMLREEGLLFFVLPLSCAANSRYMTHEHLEQLMHTVGFDKLRERWKEGRKMAYWLFRRCARRGTPTASAREGLRGPCFDKKILLRKGKRNNFCILL